MRTDPPITLVLIQCAEADRRLGAKNKRNISYLNYFDYKKDDIDQTRPYPPYLKLHPTCFPTVAQIAIRTWSRPAINWYGPAAGGKLDRRKF